MFLRKSALLVFMMIAATACIYAADITGKWEAAFDSQVGPQKYVFDFKVQGTTVTGNAVSTIGDATATTPITEGKLEGDKLTFVENLNYQGTMELKIEYKGTVSGDEIRMSRTVSGQEGETFVAKRAK